jgi:hypothetical protein
MNSWISDIEARVKAVVWIDAKDRYLITYNLAIVA